MGGGGGGEGEFVGLCKVDSELKVWKTKFFGIQLASIK